MPRYVRLNLSWSSLVGSSVTVSSAQNQTTAAMHAKNDPAKIRCSFLDSPTQSHQQLHGVTAGGPEKPPARFNSQFSAVLKPLYRIRNAPMAQRTPTNQFRIAPSCAP